MNTFECDKAKAKSNFQKHKLKFTDAARGIKEGFALTAKSPLSDKHDEERNLSIIGRTGKRAMVAIWTPRGGNVRIISVRHARNKEQEVFDAYIRQTN